jgi:hypothetical protein
MNLWLFGVAIALSGWWTGWACGRLAKANKLVDRILREETRFRHPAGSRAADLESIEGIELPEPTDYANRVAAPTAAGPLTAAEVEQFTDAWRSRIDRVQNQAWRAQASADVWCGKIVETSLGTLRCDQDPGHEGPCA